MIKFISLHIENFLSVSKADLDLDGQGLVLIEGVNEDDPSAQSNGAGKSSIVDAISWCLYGETARGVSGDSVVNLKTGKGTLVSMIVMIDGKQYNIRRGRKHKTLKNRVEVMVETTGSAMTDLTLGTDRLTQERINNLLGCTPDIFKSSIYMGQEAMPDLPAMTDKVLKGILEQALSLDKLDDALEVCKQRLGTATYEAVELNTELGRINDQITDKILLIGETNASIIAATSEHAALELELAEEKDLIREKAHEAKVFLTNLQEDLAKTPVGKTTSEIFEELDKLAADRGVEENKMCKELRSIENQTTVCARLIDSLTEQLDRLKLEPAECATCGRPYDTDHDARATHASEASKLSAHLEQVMDDLKKMAKEKALLAGKINEYRLESRGLVQAELERLTKESERYNSLLAHINAQESVLESIKSNGKTKIEGIKRMADNKSETVKNYTDMIKRAQDQLLDLQDRQAHKQVELDAANQLVDTLEKVKFILGRKGFRGEILDQVTPYLNNRTHHYLSQLTDDNISAVWNTITTNSAGEYVESFHIEVNHVSGVTKFASLSGGEKRKVRLACALALQDLVGTRAVKPIKLFVADEIDDAIDAAGLELLMGLLEEKSREVGTVLVISHNDLKDWCRNTITVVKSGGQTTFKPS